MTKDIDNNKNAVTEIDKTAQAAAAFAALFVTIKRLRAPGGCPWDIEQTPMTLRSTLLEETYETIEALEEAAADKRSSIEYCDDRLHVRAGRGVFRSGYGTDAE